MIISEQIIQILMVQDMHSPDLMYIEKPMMAVGSDIP